MLSPIGRRLPLLVAPLALAACATGGERPGATQPVDVRPTGPGASGPLIGLDAKRLVAAFGPPRLDIRETTVRKLQFASERCILDAYLYASARGREPVVTYVDARLPSGEDTDPQVCAQFLMK